MKSERQTSYLLKNDVGIHQSRFVI